MLTTINYRSRPFLPLHPLLLRKLNEVLWVYWLWVLVMREMYSIQHYVIKFVSDLRQVVGFLRVLRFPLSIKLTATI